MKFLFDFLPIVLFFIVYKQIGLNEAIMTMIAATIVQILYARFSTGKVEKMQILTLGLLIVFGGLTLWINDPAFIMWKVSVLYIVFSLALLISTITKTTLLEKMLKNHLSLPTDIWKKISYIWGFGFGIIAIINAYFVKLALNSRTLFLNEFNTEEQLSKLDCMQTSAIKLCQNAQLTEGNWVDFKLFGTFGLTIILLIITVAYVQKYIKQ